MTPGADARIRLRLALALLSLVSSCGGRSSATLAEVAVSSAARDVAVACPAGADDTDLDAVSDACELALARAFAPTLRVAEGGCNWDTSVRPERYLREIAGL